MNKRPAFAAVLLALSSVASAQTADLGSCKDRFFPNVSNKDIARAAETPLPKMADALKEDERPYTLKAGPAFFDDGGKGVKIDFFRRMKLDEGDAGSVAVSAGLGFTGRSDSGDSLSETLSVETYPRNGNGHYSHGNGHGWGHDQHDHDGDRFETLTRVYKETKIKSELFELLRVDYTTPELCGGLKMYGGVGAGVGRLTEKTKTVTDTAVTADTRHGCRRETETENSQESSYDKSRKWKPFWTAFVGCKIDGKKTLGVPCDFTVECEKIFAGELKSKGAAVTFGFGWDF